MNQSRYISRVNKMKLEMVKKRFVIVCSFLAFSTLLSSTELLAVEPITPLTSGSTNISENPEVKGVDPLKDRLFEKKAGPVQFPIKTPGSLGPELPDPLGTESVEKNTAPSLLPFNDPENFETETTDYSGDEFIEEDTGPSEFSIIVDETEDQTPLNTMDVLNNSPDAPISNRVLDVIDLKNMDISDVLMLISKKSGLNIVAANTVRG